MDLNIKINVDAIAEQISGKYSEVTSSVLEGVEQLAQLTYEQIKEDAQKSLSSDMYTKYEQALSIENSENIWIITLQEEALFLEDGQQGGFMEWLLNGKSSFATKDGGRAAVIPFTHSESAPIVSDSSVNKEVQTIKSFLKSKNISTTKIEYGANGSPRTGVLHRFNVPSAKPTKAASHDKFSGLSVTQTKGKDGKISRNVQTFRTISSKSKEMGKWFAPQTSGVMAFDEAFDKAFKIWEDVILPEIIKQYK